MKTINTALDPKILMAQAREGNEEAFSKIYENYFTPVYRYIYCRLKHPQESEDLVQTVFIKIYSSLDNFKVQTVSPLAYFFTIARNTLIDYWRKQNNNKSINIEKIENIRDNSKNPDTLIDQNNQINKIISNLKILNADQQEVIIMRFINDLSIKEIAEITQKSIDNIRQLQCRGLKKLRHHIKT